MLRQRDSSHSPPGALDMGQKRSFDDCSVSEKSTPATSTSTRADLELPVKLDHKKARLSVGSVEHSESSSVLSVELSKRIEVRLDQIFQDAIIPRNVEEVPNTILYRLQIERVRSEMMAAMVYLRKESESTSKPFQKAFSLSILPLKVDQDRWACIDQFYQIHLARARCAYIRHVWNSSDKDYKPHADCYLHDLAEYLPAVESLLMVPDNIGAILAYDLLFYLTGYLYIKASTIKQSDTTEELFAVIDVMMLRVIDRRLQAQNQSDEQGSWVAVSLSRFSQARDRLKQSGLSNYLVASILRLNEENDQRHAKDEQGMG